MARAQRNRPYYTKLPFSEALAHVGARMHRADANRPPSWWETFGHSPDDWRRVVEIAKKKAFENWWQLVLAVYAHFGIEFSAPGAHKDLALSLAFRHERNLLVQGGRICYAALCERYGVDPDEQGAEVTLVFALVRKYVEREKSDGPLRSDDWGTRFSTVELASLTMAIGEVKDHLLGKNEDASVHAIARCVQDQKRLAGIVSDKAAKYVHGIMLRRGNKSKGVPKPLSEKSTTRLRQIIHDMQTLEVALRSRKLTAVQMQLYFSVIPLLGGSTLDRMRHVAAIANRG